MQTFAAGGRVSSGRIEGSALMIWPVVHALEARGVDPAPLLCEVGIDRRALMFPFARFADASVQALWLRAPDVAGDPDFGVTAAELSRDGMLALFDELAASSETLRDAYERCQAHLRLLHDAAAVRLVTSGPLTRLQILPDLAAPLPRAQVEYFVACLVLRTRRMTGVFEHPRAACLKHAKPRFTARLEAFFECPLHFGADLTEVVFPTSWLEVPVLSANAQLRRAVEQRARTLLSELNESLQLTARVGLSIGAELHVAEPSLQAIAKRLAMSPRTLKRRLRDAGTSYSAQLDAVRQRWAARYLLDPDEPLHDIARRLGFSNPTAFFKAHKRWTGLTPLAARKTRDVRLVGARSIDDREL
jgi:AraC-like DNA-binding protein